MAHGILTGRSPAPVWHLHLLAPWPNAQSLVPHVWTSRLDLTSSLCLISTVSALPVQVLSNGDMPAFFVLNARALTACTINAGLHQQKSAMTLKTWTDSSTLTWVPRRSFVCCHVPRPSHFTKVLPQCILSSQLTNNEYQKPFKT